MGKLTTMPTKHSKIYGTSAINLISASLTPPFLFVARMLTQSLNGPAVNSPIMPPTTNAKFRNPTCAGPKRYGGAAKTWLCVKFRANRQFVEKQKDITTQKTIGKKKIWIGVKTSRIRSAEPS